MAQSAVVEIYAREIWSGHRHISQVDGTNIHAEVRFDQEPWANGSITVLHFEVLAGTVTVTPPPLRSAGCPQTIAPDTHSMAPADGTMTMTYDPGSGDCGWRAVLSFLSASDASTQIAASDH